MLIVVLLLVVAAGGVLVGSVVVDHPQWAWLAVVLSLAGTALLVVERVRRRRKPSSAPARPSTGELAEPDGADLPEAVGGGLPSGAVAAAVRPAEPRGEPGEETTDPADLLAIAQGTDPVLVVDERPRYHLESCDWLGDRATIPLPLNEARELGFTPCVRCSPNATFAARQRATA